MTDEIRFNQNINTGNINPALIISDGAKIQTEPLASDAGIAAEKTEEDNLVEYSISDNSTENDTKSETLQQQYLEKMNEYSRYQNELNRLKQEAARIERQIEKCKDDETKTAKLQSELTIINNNISNTQAYMQNCMYDMQALNIEILLALEEENTDNLIFSGKTLENSSVASTSSVHTNNSAQENSSLSAASTQNTPYTGTAIPKELAQKLDNRLGSGFSQKCESVAAKLNCNVNDLLAMMYSESGLKTTARNKSSNAVGLIQFIPSTLKSNGYTTEQVASMNAVQQLDVVADIFMKAKKMAGYGANEKIDGGTLYAINWLPAYAKRNTIVSKGEKYYSAGLDMNKDGSVTKNDLTQRLRKKYNEMANNI